MSISSRIHNTINEWAIEWGDKLRTWWARIIMDGVEKTFDFFEPDIRTEVKPSLARIRDIPGLPDDIKSIINKAIEEPKAIHLAALLPYLIAFIMGTAMGAARPIANWASYPLERLIHSYRVDPIAWITAFRRKYKSFADIEDDLKEQGWSDERIEALKFYTLYYPSPAELIHWTAREVFEPTMIDKYGLKAGMERLRREDFYKAGMDDDQIDNHWIAHWEHASWMQVIEMLHRKIITEQDVKDWFPLVEMAPYWAENLIKIAYTWPTRVDVRRWWDMRTIDEDRLKELYEGMGYRGENLDDYIKWTKVYTDFPMMIARFTKGWITEDEVYNWLISLEIPEERARHFIEEKVKKEAPERVTKERDLTKSEIIKGVKKEVISIHEGIELLRDMGYSEDEAEYMIEINVTALAGSPETYSEFKRITQLYRKAQGLQAKILPPELIEAGKALKEAETALKEAEEKGFKEAKLAPYLKAKSDAEYRYRQLLVKWQAEK